MSTDLKPVFHDRLRSPVSTGILPLQHVISRHKEIKCGIGIHGRFFQAIRVCCSFCNKSFAVCNSKNPLNLAIGLGYLEYTPSILLRILSAHWIAAATVLSVRGLPWEIVSSVQMLSDDNPSDDGHYTLAPFVHCGMMQIFAFASPVESC
jgi:hypothetical protein